MPIAEASLTGTLRVIAVLAVVWFVLRMIANRRAKQVGSARWANPDGRTRGEVRIERDRKAGDSAKGHGPTVIDADYEEVK